MQDRSFGLFAALSPTARQEFNAGAQRIGSFMANLNRVLLIGNLTRDPEIRYTPKGTAVADIALAVNRVFTGEDGEKREEVTYVDVVVWSRLAEISEQYLKNGRPVFIEGRMRLDSSADKQTGQKRSRLRVVAENLQ